MAEGQAMAQNVKKRKGSKKSKRTCEKCKFPKFSMHSSIVLTRLAFAKEKGMEPVFHFHSKVDPANERHYRIPASAFNAAGVAFFDIVYNKYSKCTDSTVFDAADLAKVEELYVNDPASAFDSADVALFDIVYNKYSKVFDAAALAKVEDEGEDEKEKDKEEEENAGADEKKAHRKLTPAYIFNYLVGSCEPTEQEDLEEYQDFLIGSLYYCTP